MTKKEYIKKHPKSYLALKLTNTAWVNNAKIIIGSGLNAPNNKNSNLYAALQGSSGEYIIGGHLRSGTEGWYFAVRA